MLTLLVLVLVRVLFGAPSLATADESLLETGASPCIQTPTNVTPPEAPSSISPEVITSSTTTSPAPSGTTATDGTPSPSAEETLAPSTSTTSTPLITESEIVPPTEQSSPPPTVTETTVPLIVHLERISPAPSNGKESVTVFTDESPTIARFFGWKIADSTGPIFLITSSTINHIAVNDHEITVFLPSAKLNNSGDLVALYDANGQLIDFTRYPSAEKDAVWKRQSDDSWSFVENHPTSIQGTLPQTTTSSAAHPTTTTTTTTTTTPLISASTESTTSTPHLTQTKTLLATKKNPSTVTPETVYTPPKTITTDTSIAIRKPVTKSLSAKKTSKTAVAKTTPSPITNLDSLPDPSAMSQPVRVRLFGLVATTPHLFQKQQFILLNSEGKGLLVKVPSTKQSPPRGSWVSVTGNLELNDSGYTLAMKSNDAWTREKDGVLSAPKTLDDLSSDERLDWTLTVAEGEITAIKSSGLTILTATDEVFIAIPSHLQMRAGRFNKGDRLRIHGLLDPRKDALTILVQQTDAILSLPKPAAIAPTPTTSSEQPWETVLAAGGAVALTHGAKHAHKQYKKRLLAKNLKLAEAALLADPGALANQEQIR